jgi:hypothetical protein
LTDLNEWLMSIAGNNSIGLQFRVRDVGDANDEATLATKARMSIIRNGNVGIGTNNPTSPLHVVGNGLFTGNLTVNGALNATLPSGSGNYIQNTTSPQASSNFNISGTGTAGILNATTQFNIGGSRVLSAGSGGNLFVGPFTGSQNASGQLNSFFGDSAGSSNTNGDNNSFFGVEAGIDNTDGAFNSFFGVDAGGSNQTGQKNSFFGSFSGLLSTGDFNSYFGQDAGKTIANGNSNAFFGQLTGAGAVTANSVTLLGYAANAADNLTNATAIGAQAQVTQSNRIVLGSINGVNGATADTKVGISTPAPDAYLQVRKTPVDKGAATFFMNTGAMFKSATNNGGSTPAAGETALVLAREGIAGQAFANFARFNLMRYENVSTNSRTQLDIGLSHGDLGTEGNNTPAILSLESGGNVGIGVTTPLAKLDLLGGADNNGGNDPHAMAFSYRSGGFRHWIRTRHNSVAGTGNAIDFYVNNSSTSGGSSAPGTGNVLTMSLAGGNVGIGTNAPGRLLDVNAAVGDGIRVTNSANLYFRNGANSADVRAIAVDGNDRVMLGGNATTSAIIFNTGSGAGSEQMRISDTGNVGIGTSDNPFAPSAKLQVSQGDIYVDTQSRGIILRATDGPNCYRVTVNNVGALSAAVTTCP